MDPDLTSLPEILRAPTAARVEQLAAALDPAVLEQLLADAGTLRTIACSGFVVRTLCRWPWLAGAWSRGEELLSAAALAGATAAIPTLEGAQAMAALRELRQTRAATIALRDISGDAPLETTLADLSALADACILAALSCAREQLRPRYGVPRDGEGAELLPVVLAMGKLGGGELNFSSDVDLIFSYPRQGETDGDRREPAELYFTQLVRRVIKLLDEVTEDGFVYRTDVRLRPFGDSGPLVMSTGAMEQYYQQHGRDWERYAMIKARPLSADPAAAAELESMLRPFVYRRYLDYGAFDALREMKSRVDSEAQRRGLGDHLKLGPGGIRELEFIVQTFQLIRGGRRPALRDRRLLPVLAALAEEGVLAAAEAEGLAAAYRHLRDVEDRLQMMEDAQTHDLPEDALGRARLALAMGDACWEDTAAALSARRELVADSFAQLVVGPGHLREVADDPVSNWMDAGQEGDPPLLALGFSEEAARAAGERLRGASFRQLDREGRRRLTRLLPLLVREVAARETCDDLLSRVLDVIARIGRRSAYFALLVERPDALQRLVQRCDESRWFAAQLAAEPVLLDELMDLRGAEQAWDRERLREDLAAQLAAVGDDQELRMERMRWFRNAQTVRIAQAELDGALPLMKVSDRLSDLAEVLLEAALQDALIAADATGAGSFLTVAYGKLGGLELSYSSDLDLVFLYGGGDDAMAAQATFLRVARKLVHALTTPTLGGVLYEVDMRLRPSGQSGLLVSHLPAFQRYQEEEAWTWEHQALLRSRAVAGDRELAESFEALRRQVLVRERDRAQLAEDVRGMRERLRTAADASERASLKQVPGGLMDLEFLVQFHCLALAAAHPEVVTYSDNVRQLEALGASGAMDAALCEELTAIYLAYRSWSHRRDLQLADHTAEAAGFASEQDLVSRAWDQGVGGSDRGRAL